MDNDSIVIILDNIRSTLNVGAIFRTADGVGVDKIYLCGITATPKHPKIIKTALGAEESVSWEHRSNTVLTINKLRKSGYQIIGLELNTSSFNFWETRYQNKVALVVGNEVSGLVKKTIEACDLLIEIPMVGQKESLNVATATGVALYEILRQKKYLDNTTQ